MTNADTIEVANGNPEVARRAELYNRLARSLQLMAEGLGVGPRFHDGLVELVWQGEERARLEEISTMLGFMQALVAPQE